MSKFLQLDWRDLVKGLVVSVLTSVITLLIQELQTGTINWNTIGIAALSSGLGYILKQLATDHNGDLLGKV
jgi:phosphoglycerol transferase MdoB-like AlkP superfamily enzyme